MALLALIFQNSPGCLLAEVEHQGFCPKNSVLLKHHNDPEASIGPMLVSVAAAVSGHGGSHGLSE
jgi:hypothetical protein